MLRIWEILCISSFSWHRAIAICMSSPIKFSTKSLSNNPFCDIIGIHLKTSDHFHPLPPFSWYLPRKPRNSVSLQLVCNKCLARVAANCCIPIDCASSILALQSPSVHVTSLSPHAPIYYLNERCLPSSALNGRTCFFQPHRPPVCWMLCSSKITLPLFYVHMMSSRFNSSLRHGLLFFFGPSPLTRPREVESRLIWSECVCW